MVFGHELMIYTYGGYTKPDHVQYFTRMMKKHFLGAMWFDLSPHYQYPILLDDSCFDNSS